jgi:hypothetical protein
MEENLEESKPKNHMNHHHHHPPKTEELVIEV